MNKLPQVLIILGIFLIVVSLSLFVWIYLPVIAVELNYNLHKPSLTVNEIKPIDKEFGIVIPKIVANARIIPDVDPYNPMLYQFALTKGVALTKGSTTPDKIGNMFIFSHSSANLLDATRYNSVFYLLAKMNKGDEIYIYYKNVKYKYVVSETKLVDAKDISYLTDKSAGKTLTLMTCWPPGTNFKRLLVFATQK